MPSFEPPSAYHPAPAARPRSTSPSPRSSLPRSSASSDSLAPPRIVLFSGALEDTFRIPASDSATTTAWRARRTRRRASREDLSADDDPDSIVVIPPLGDREVENNVRRLLGHHGVRARTTVLDAESDPREPLDGAGDGSRDREGDEMDVDERESDCLSSHAPSRSGSPAPASQLSLQSLGARPLELLRSRPTLFSRRESSGPYAASRWGSASSRRTRRATGSSREPARDEPEEEQDLAGMCFDPSGTFVYVASVKGVAEWRIRGAEQRWWTEPEWA